MSQQVEQGLPPLPRAHARLAQVFEPAVRAQGHYIDEESFEETRATCCAFCGEQARVWRWVVPLDLVRQFDRLADDGVAVWTWVVPSCEECHRVLGADLYRSVEAMREHVRDALRRRYAEVLEMEDHDLDEYGPGLRDYIDGSMAKRDMTKKRLEHLGPLPKGFGSPSVGLRVSRML